MFLSKRIRWKLVPILHTVENSPQNVRNEILKFLTFIIYKKDSHFSLNLIIQLFFVTFMMLLFVTFRLPFLSWKKKYSKLSRVNEHISKIFFHLCQNVNSIGTFTASIWSFPSIFIENPWELKAIFFKKSSRIIMDFLSKYPRSLPTFEYESCKIYAS